MIADRNRCQTESDRTGSRRFWELAGSCLVLLASAHLALAAPGVTAWLDRDTVAAGDSFILTLTFEGLAPPGAPSLPALPNLRLLSVGTSSQMTVNNGQATTQTSYNYTFSPLQPGTVVIPAMQVPVNNQVFKTDPLTLKVTKPAEIPPTATNGAFLRLVVPKAEIFRGEVLPIEINLHVLMANNAQMPQLAGDGFTVGNITQQPTQRARVGNQVFTVAPFRTYLTTTRPGTLTIGPATMALHIPAPGARRTIFGDVVDWQPVVLTSEAFQIQSLPLPTQNVPPGFSGAVGSYSLTVTAGPTNLSVGDPITVKLKLSGKGPLDTLSLPDQPQWREFKTYPPSSTVESSDVYHLAGAKNFEQVIIPLNHEIKALPPFQFTYFDSEQKTYRTLSNSFIPLSIKPSGTANVPAFASTNAADQGAPPVDEILHIKAQVEPQSAGSGPLLWQGWFLALQAVPVAGWLALFTLRKRNEALANNPRRQRQRLVDARLQSGLRELRSLASEQKSDAFHATLFRLLQEKLGERLDLPASAITEAVVDEHLQKRLSAEAQRGLHELFHACNQAKYASQSSQVELTALLAKAEVAFRELQALPA